jgi:hypothetical protein
MNLRNHLTYANLAATAALTIACATGTSYAATKIHLPKNSVTAKQIRTGAVRSAEIKDGTIAGVDLAVGAVGGGQVADGSLGADDLSPTARSQLATSNLPSGATERGFWALNGDIPDNSDNTAIGVSLPMPAPSVIATTDVLTDGYAEGANLCTGTLEEPTAPRGKVCVYTQHNASLASVNAEDFYVGGSRYGFGIHLIPTFSYANVGGGGSWAYTAP